ncbi:MAG: phenylacetate--CoA ligase family protein, partial [Bacteroidales bacterium]|nr:phenylacetate--CoA ligase family protein [Bacteroidales bacterium]
MDIEFKSPEEIKKFQEQLLRGALDYLATHSRYYQRVFKDNGIDVSEINTIEDLQKIPFTEKKELQLFNEDFLCCPKADIVDYVTTSGTLGDPVTFGCTEKDLQRLDYNEKKSFA